METFAELLTLYIRQAGITDTELARTIGVSRQTIFRWREGLTGRPNNREDVIAIANKLRLIPLERDSLLLAAGFRPDEISGPAEDSPGEPADTEKTAEKEKTEDGVIDIPVRTESSQFPKKNPVLRISKRTAFYAGLIVLIPVIIWLVVITVIPDNDSPNNKGVSNQTSVLPVSPAVIEPAVSGETLVLVTKFCSSGDNEDLSDRITTAISRESTGNRIPDFRVESVAESIDSFSEADKYREDKSASLVLFGECYPDTVKFRISTGSNRSYPVIEISASDTACLDALSLITLGKACIDSGYNETAFSLIAKARNILTDNAVNNETLSTVIDDFLAEVAER